MKVEQIEKEIEFIKRNDCLSTADKKMLIADLENEKRSMALVENGDLDDVGGNI